jgi:hypothetical protein
MGYLVLPELLGSAEVPSIRAGWEGLSACTRDGRFKTVIF